MVIEPIIKRTVAFFDGQNLFHVREEAFGYRYPNYDAPKLAAHVCQQRGWRLERACFSTGVPNTTDEPFWNTFWDCKAVRNGLPRSACIFPVPSISQPSNCASRRHQS